LQTLSAATLISVPEKAIKTTSNIFVECDHFEVLMKLLFKRYLDTVDV
jgi:hypothetical protein